MSEALDLALALEILSMGIDDEQPEVGVALHIQAHAGGGEDLHKIGFAHAGSGEDAHMVVHCLAMQSHGDLLHQAGSISEVSHLDVSHDLAQETELVFLCSLYGREFGGKGAGLPEPSCLIYASQGLGYDPVEDLIRIEKVGPLDGGIPVAVIIGAVLYVKHPGQIGKAAVSDREDLPHLHPLLSREVIRHYEMVLGYIF